MLSIYSPWFFYRVFVMFFCSIFINPPKKDYWKILPSTILLDSNLRKFTFRLTNKSSVTELGMVIEDQQMHKLVLGLLEL